MSLHIRTSDEKLIQSPLRKRKATAEELPMRLDPSMDEYTWSVYNGNELVLGPYEVLGGPTELFGIMRGMLKQAGYQEPEAPPLATSRSAEPPPKREAVKAAKTEAKSEVISALPSLQITDDETGEIVEITEEMRFEARRVHDDIAHHGAASMRHLYEFGKALMRMRDGSLHLALGYRSFSAYCESLKLSRSTVSERIAAAETLDRLIQSGTVRPVEQIGYMNLVLISRANPEDVEAVAASQGLADLSKREMKEALEEAKAERLRREEAERRASQLETTMAKITEENQRLKAAPPPPPNEVKVDNPELLERITALEQERQREAARARAAEAENTRLLAELQGEQQAKARREQAEKAAEAAETRARRLKDVEFDDTGLDPNGGRRLMDATDPLLKPVATAIAIARQLKISGAGGYCLTEPIYQLVADMRELTDLVSKILEVRNKSTLIVSAKEGSSDERTDVTAQG